MGWAGVGGRVGGEGKRVRCGYADGCLESVHTTVRGTLTSVKLANARSELLSDGGTYILLTPTFSLLSFIPLSPPYPGVPRSNSLTFLTRAVTTLEQYDRTRETLIPGLSTLPSHL